MMGQQAGAQDELFYSFNLDAHVPADHLLRGIDRFLDLGELRRHLAAFYSHTGRPSIDPELMMRMLIIGYCFGIRSERRLCDEVHLNLAYRWFCRLGLQDTVPGADWPRRRLGAGLAGARQASRPAHPGVGPIRTRRRHLQSFRLQL
jgi:transposase